MRSRIAILSLAVGAGSVLAACGSDTPSVDEAKEDFCQAVAEVAQDEDALANLNAESTVDDAQTAVSNLKSAVDAAKDAAEEVGQAEADAVESAYDDLQSTIEGISGSDTLAEAAPTVAEAAATFKASLDEIRSKNCGGAVASTTATT